MNSIAERCKSVLENHYGSQFRGLVLYGSMARQEAESSSDVDLLVLLSKPFDYFQTLWEIIDLLYPLQLDSEQLISAKPAAADEFAAGEIQLYRSVRSEGVTV